MIHVPQISNTIIMVNKYNVVLTTTPVLDQLSKQDRSLAKFRIICLIKPTEEAFEHPRTRIIKSEKESYDD